MGGAAKGRTTDLACVPAAATKRKRFQTNMNGHYCSKAESQVTSDPNIIARVHNGGRDIAVMKQSLKNNLTNV